MIAATAILFSTGGAAIKSCTLTAPQVAGLRSVVAAVVIAAAFPRARRRPSAATLAIGACYASCLMLFVWANKLTTAALAIFIQYTAPAYMLFLAPLVLREPVGRSDVARTFAAMGGMGLLFLGTPGATASAPDPQRGNLFAVASGVAWALTLVGLRWRGRDDAADASLDVVVWGNLLAFVCNLPGMAGLTMSRVDVVAVVYLGVVQVGLAYVLLTFGMRHVPALDATLLLLLEPVLSPVWALWLQGEQVSLLSLAGGAVVTLASVKLPREASPHDATSPSEEDDPARVY